MHSGMHLYRNECIAGALEDVSHVSLEGVMDENLDICTLSV